MITPEMDMAATEILLIYSVAAVGIGCLIAGAVKLYGYIRGKRKKGIMVEVRPDPVRQHTLAKMLEQEEKVRRGSWESMQRANGWK